MRLSCFSAASELCVGGLRCLGPQTGYPFKARKSKAAGKPFWTIANNEECPGVGECIQLCTPSTQVSRKPREEAFKSENKQNKHVHIAQLPGDSAGNRRQVNGTLKTSSKSLEPALGLLFDLCSGVGGRILPPGDI